MDLDPKVSKLCAFLLVAAPAGSLAWMLATPADPANAILFGMSAARLALFGFQFLLALLSLILAATFLGLLPTISQTLSKQIHAGTVLSLTTWGSLLLLAFANSNPVAVSGASALLDRLRPLALTLGVILGCYSLAAQSVTGKLNTAAQAVRTYFKTNQKSIAVAVAVILILFLLSIPLYPDGMLDDYWWELPVPILAWQAIASLLLGAALQRLMSGRSRIIQIGAVALLYILIAFAWVSVPITNSFFNPKPAPPTNQAFPYSDAAGFGLEAQTSLQGYGLNAGNSLDRPFYPAFLAAVHAIAGQDYASVAHLQTFLFAIITVFLFLLGTELLGQAFGFTLMAASAFWGLNLLQLNGAITTATPQQFMSDFPAAITLAAAAWLSVRWLKGSQPSPAMAVLVGAALGLGSFIRYNTLGVIPFLLLLLALKLGRQWRVTAKQVALFALGFALVATPWIARNVLTSPDASLPLVGKVKFILTRRYSPTLSENSRNGKNPAKAAQQGLEGLATTPTADKNKPSATYWFPAHMVHNLLAPVFALPGDLAFQPLAASIATNKWVWDRNFNGIPHLPGGLIYLLQVIVLAAGFATIHRKDKTSAWILLLAFVGFSLTNSLGRTSGGRYIVPTTWLAFVFYLAAFANLFQVEPAKVATEKPGTKRAIPIAILIALLIGLFPVGWDVLSRSLYTPIPRPSLDALLADAGDTLNPNEPTRYSNLIYSHFSSLASGAAIYPLQSKDNMVPQNLGYQTVFNNKKVLTFYLALPYQTKFVVMHYERPLTLAPNQRVAVVGCEVTNAIIAWGLWIYDDAGNVQYLRSQTKFTDCDPTTYGVK